MKLLPASRPALALLGAAAVALAAGPSQAQTDDDTAARPDLLRLRNGDVLQGDFRGITKEGKLQWAHPDMEGVLDIDLGTLQRVGLNGGRAFTTLASHSYVELENGDRIAGTIHSLDPGWLEIETPFAGTLRLPRKHLAKLSPNPHGGLVHYLGPYSEEGWSIRDLDAPAEGQEANEDAENEEAGGADAGDAPSPDPWMLAGGAWYSNGDAPLCLEDKLTDRTRITFKLAWRSRLNAIVAIHATMAQPEPAEVPEEQAADAPRQRRVAPNIRGNNQGFAATYGASYVLTLYANYAILYRVSFDEDGKGVVDRLSSTNSQVRLDEVGEAEFELRCDRKNASITLYIDGSFVGQWGDPKGYVATGNNLAFATKAEDSHLRLSDVVVTSWNGMLDSALSMESEERDVLLLTNGTDRFSGEVIGISGGSLHLRGAFAEMHIPLADIEEVRFARDGVSPLPEASEEAMRIVLQPVGRLTVVPHQSTPEVLEGALVTGDQVSLSLEHVGVLQFALGDSILDVWDQDF